MISGFLVALGALPMTLWFWLWTFAWRVRLYLGRWPYYGHPDPKNLPDRFQPQTEILENLIPWGAFLLLVFVVTRLVGRVPNYKVRMLVASLLSVAGWAIAFGLLFLDPGDFFEWIID